MAVRIRERNDGRFEARITINGERISTYGRSRTEVLAKAKKKKWEVENHGLNKRSDKLCDSMQLWLENVKRISGIKPSSYDRTESIFREHILNSSIAKKRIESIESLDIQIILNSKRDDGYSRSTIKKIYGLFREYFRYQVATDSIVKDPMRLVGMPAIEESDADIEFFTKDEMSAIISAAESVDVNGNRCYRYGEAIILLLLTGLRNGELRALTIDSVDLDNNTIQVNRTISRAIDEKTGKRVNMIQMPKTKNAIRTIPLSNRAVEAVRNLIDTTYDEHSGYLITTENGNILSHTLLQRAYDRILKKAGLEHKGLHSTRHTFGTLMVKKAEAEGQIKEASELLGHSRVSTTYDYYVGTSIAEKVNLIHTLDAIV